MKNLFVTLVLLFLGASAYAQTGTIKGNVKDARTGEAIIGANVVIQGTAIGSATDVEGNFVISKVSTGTHTLLVTFVSYKNLTIPNVTVEANKSTVINTTLEENVSEIGEVVITAERPKGTEIAVITEIKQAEAVAVGVSSQQISKSQDRDAAQVIQRVPGVTIIDNRFVMVRGLTERYNSVRLNGATTPSMEVDSRAFSFDVIPSGLIDRLMIYKSGSPELPGDFAGAVINVYTKNTVDANSTSVSLSTSYRSGTTFNDAYTYKGSSTDLLGFDNGDRALPSDFPSKNLRETYDPNVLAAAGKTLPNNWALEKQTASPDIRFSVNLARRFDLGNVKVSNISSVGYTYSNQFLTIDNYRYDNFNPTSGISSRRYKYEDNQANNNVRLGVISNWAFKLDENNRIEFRNMYNRIGNKQTVVRTGVEDVQGFEVQNYALNYLSRGIYAGQLQGKHDLTDKTSVDWLAGFANTKRDQPDFRRARTQRPVGGDGNFQVVIPPNASPFDAGRFYSELNENLYTLGGNVEYKLNNSGDEDRIIKLRAGFYTEYKYRTFDVRWMSYSLSNSSTLLQENPDLLASPLEQIFTPENISAKGFTIQEGTNYDDPYQASNKLAAGYIGISIPFASKFNLSGGLRNEYNDQELSTNNKKVVDNPINSILPSVNLAYNFTEKMLVRVAYSKTVNRPEFREIAPFSFYDFNQNTTVLGNASLKVADIHNLDLRWELYPKEDENIALGVFYKKFNNPIEMLGQGGSNLIFYPENAVEATSLGAEVEIRKSLADISASPVLQNLTILLNGSLIKSTVDVGNNPLLVKERPMFGQSPYVINAGLYYNNPELKLQANVLYNVFGKRIILVGDVQENPTWYELPRNVLDFTVTKGLGEKFEIKVGIQDILNQKTRIVQDSNSDSEIKSVDEPIMNWRRGQYTTIGVTYNF